MPAWAQVAAALLFLGVSAGDREPRRAVRRQRPQRSHRLDAAPAAARRSTARQPAGGTAALTSTDAATPWRAELAALEQQLRTEMRSVRTAAAQPPAAMRAAAPTSDADLVKRVRALVDESEKRQQRELALRVAEVVRDVATQRQADLVKIDRTLGVVQNNLGLKCCETGRRLEHPVSRITEAVGGHRERVSHDRHRGNRRGRGRPRRSRPWRHSRRQQAARLATQQRYQIGQMERVLEGAVEHGVTVTRDRVQALAQVPADLLVSDNAHARGFRLEGYGVFFDVIVPSFETTLTWSLRTLDQNDLGLDSALRDAADARQDVGRSRPRTGAEAHRAAGEPVLARPSTQASLASSSVSGVAGARTVTGSAASTDDTASAGTIDPVLADPNEAYRTEVIQALKDAMLAHSSALGIGPSEWLTIAAKGQRRPAAARAGRQRRAHPHHPARGLGSGRFPGRQAVRAKRR